MLQNIVISAAHQSNTGQLTKLLESIGGGTGGGDLMQNIMPNLVEMLLGLAGLSAFVVVLVAGYMMVTSFGDEEKRTKAKQMIFFGILGIGFIVLAFTLVKALTSFTFDN